jgi:hypothetical protein
VPAWRGSLIAGLRTQLWARLGAAGFEGSRGEGAAANAVALARALV